RAPAGPTASTLIVSGSLRTGGVISVASSTVISPVSIVDPGVKGSSSHRAKGSAGLGLITKRSNPAPGVPPSSTVNIMMSPGAKSGTFVVVIAPTTFASFPLTTMQVTSAVVTSPRGTKANRIVPVAPAGDPTAENENC